MDKTVLDQTSTYLEAFKEYLASEYKNSIKNCSAIDWNFSHSLSSKLDRKSNKCINQHYITINMSFYDKEMKLLCKAVMKFINNELPKQFADKLVNISPAELTNKFMYAKQDIIHVINDEYRRKQYKINIKIEQLKQYCETNSIAISKEFKGELTQISDAHGAGNSVSPKNNVIAKKEFNM